MLRLHWEEGPGAGGTAGAQALGWHCVPGTARSPPGWGSVTAEGGGAGATRCGEPGKGFILMWAPPAADSAGQAVGDQRPRAPLTWPRAGVGTERVLREQGHQDLQGAWC